MAQVPLEAPHAPVLPAGSLPRKDVDPAGSSPSGEECALLAGRGRCQGVVGPGGQ